MVSVFLVINFVLYFNILACAKGLKGSVLTNSSSGIQHAWHFWYAVVLVLKCHAVTLVLRASPLNWALGILYSHEFHFVLKEEKCLKKCLEKMDTKACFFQ